ncbi:MAG: Zn-ribbon domain-containing OB-fold protein [Candidatus Ranarchaeia archaeon]|jgi:uncharacterized OB-fold protein
MSVPQYWRKIPSNFRLEALKCTECGEMYFTKQKVCNKCGNAKMEMISLPHHGKIVTYSIIHTPPVGFELQTPYAIALVELDNKVRMTTQITDCDPAEIKVGMEVEAIFRKMQEDGDAGIIQYGHKFRPIVKKS